MKTISKISSFVYYQGEPPNSLGTKWANVVQLRENSGDPKLFDDELFKTLQYFTPNSSISEDDMWVYFDTTIARLSSLVAYWPVFREVMLNGMAALVNDGIQVLEIRGFNALNYDDSGILSPIQVVQYWINLIEGIYYLQNVIFRIQFKFYNTFICEIYLQL